MNIREWKREDLPQVNVLLLELGASIGHEHHADVTLLERHFDAMSLLPDTYRAFVYEIDGMIAGFISLVFYASVLHRKGTALVNELVVSETHRGKGIGRALMDHAVAVSRAERWDEIEVGVVRLTTKAIAFYKTCGLDQEYLLLGKEFE